MLFALEQLDKNTLFQNTSNFDYVIFTKNYNILELYYHNLCVYDTITLPKRMICFLFTLQAILISKVAKFVFMQVFLTLK